MPATAPDQTLPLAIFLILMASFLIAAVVTVWLDQRKRNRREAVATSWEKRPTGRRAGASLITSSVHEKHLRDSGTDHRIGNNPPTAPLL